RNSDVRCRPLSPTIVRARTSAPTLGGRGRGSRSLAPRLLSPEACKSGPPLGPPPLSTVWSVPAADSSPGGRHGMILGLPAPSPPPVPPRPAAPPRSPAFFLIDPPPSRPPLLSPRRVAFFFAPLECGEASPLWPFLPPRTEEGKKTGQSGDASPHSRRGKGPK